ncbi:hypothetical protein NDU88_001159 [Pleurodeles waltl]|uniref:Uncharacterized protein n=1 Tax=Pleurodeles waltl TaxID=8319 RepID=A0AAV7UV93_PLEWA|nr:hypothetical protein NDU88_001159 [Pleurodeles waltl]
MEVQTWKEPEEELEHIEDEVTLHKDVEEDPGNRSRGERSSNHGTSTCGSALNRGSRAWLGLGPSGSQDVQQGSIPSFTPSPAVVRAARSEELRLALLPQTKAQPKLYEIPPAHTAGGRAAELRYIFVAERVLEALRADLNEAAPLACRLRSSAHRALTLQLTVMMVHYSSTPLDS